MRELQFFLLLLPNWKIIKVNLRIKKGGNRGKIIIIII